MKSRFLFFLLIISFFSSKLRALDFSFSVEPGISFKKSLTEEALFFNGYFGSDSSDICSLLEWNEKYVGYFDLNTTLRLSSEKNGFLFSNGISLAFPYNEGMMCDTDWNISGKKSDYSEFDNNIHRCYELSTMFSYEREITPLFTLRPSLSLSYNYISFEGKNGHGWRDMDTLTPHYYPDGKYHLAGIDYESKKISVFMSFAAVTRFSDSFSLLFGAGLSPFSFVLAMDRHLARDYVTEDYIYNYFRNYTLFAELGYKLSEKILLCLSLKSNWFLFTKGDEYYNYDDGDFEISSQKAGYSYRELSCRFGLKVFLFDGTK